MVNLRLKNAIGIVQNKAEIEFFNSNTRESIALAIDFPEILDFLKKFDGKNSIDDIYELFPSYTKNSLSQLLRFLHQNNVLISDDIKYSKEEEINDNRLISFLEDYCQSSSEVVEKIALIKNSCVMIIGLGSVGSLIAVYLAKMGVTDFILVDKDKVDISNLHRQYYFEDQISMAKVDALSTELKKINPNSNCIKIKEYLTDTFFDKTNLPEEISLIINCADEPSVDYTSRIIAEHAMHKNIPHIIGGGYNLHLTLIGQTIIPFSTACFDCFTKNLNELNLVELNNVRKLHRENRKVGSFPPLSGIASTLAALDAIKIIIKKHEYLNNNNKRIEFSLKDYSINTIEINKHTQCEWCNNEKNSR